MDSKRKFKDFIQNYLRNERYELEELLGRFTDRPLLLLFMEERKASEEEENEYFMLHCLEVFWKCMTIIKDEIG